MILTAREIKELAEYALGIKIEDHCFDSDEDLDEYEFSVEVSPEAGVLDESTNTLIKTKHVVSCDGCDPSECIPIGVKTAQFNHQYEQ